MPEYIMVATQRGDTREQQFNQIIKQLEKALRIQLSTNLTLTEEGIKIKIYHGEKVLMERPLRSDEYSIDGNVIIFSREFLEQIAALVLTNPNLKLEVSFSAKSKNEGTYGTRQFTLSSNISMLRQLDINPLTPFVVHGQRSTVEQFGQNTVGLMLIMKDGKVDEKASEELQKANLQKAQQAARVLVELLTLLERGSNDPNKLKDELTS
jgi:hypothetical protein